MASAVACASGGVGGGGGEINGGEGGEKRCISARKTRRSNRSGLNVSVSVFGAKTRARSRQAKGERKALCPARQCITRAGATTFMCPATSCYQ